MSKKPNNIYVLIVEDEPDLNRAYTTVLQAENMEVDSCFNGEEAIAKVAIRPPDVILLDLRMPKMDGLEFLRQFREHSNAKKTKIIIASNYDEQKEIDTAFSLGADRYMLKSWTSPKELVKLVREVSG
jgi:two-component system KDP operon response regulator KdpE